MSQDVERKAAAVFVALPVGATEVAGYYSLSSLSVRLAGLPEATAKRLPRYPDVPATLLGRLAVDNRHQKKRLGERLLVDALTRALRTSREVASFAVVVDAIDEAAQQFYEHFQFVPFPAPPRRLFLPMKSIARIFDRSRARS